jgi:chromosome segregation ATPase
MQLELEGVRTRLHELELEGYETAEYVEKLQADILAAQADLESQRQRKAELARRIGDYEHGSVEAYQRNAAMLEDNARMQGELQRLQGDLDGARDDIAANRRLAAEREAQLAREQAASEELFKQVQALESEAEQLETTIKQRHREKELELHAAQSLMSDLKRLAPDLHASGQPGVDQALRRQVLMLQTQNEELIQELAGWGARAAKQDAIHKTVGEMTAQPSQLRAENARLAAELDAVQKQNARRHAAITQHAFSHRQQASQPQLHRDPPPPSPLSSRTISGGRHAATDGQVSRSSSVASPALRPTGPTSWF